MDVKSSFILLVFVAVMPVVTSSHLSLLDIYITLHKFKRSDGARQNNVYFSSAEPTLQSAEPNK